MTQSGAPKTIRGKAARPASLGSSVPQPEQLALLLDPLSAPSAFSGNAQAGVPAAKASRTGKDKRAPGQAEESTAQVDWTADADEAIAAPAGLAHDAANTVLVAQAAGTAAGSTSGSSDAAAATSSGSSSGAGVLGLTQAEIASMAPALFAFSAGVLVLRDATSSSSATPAVNAPPEVVTSLAVLNAGVKADEGLPVTFKVGAFRDPEGGPLTFKFAVTTAAGQPVDTSAWTFTLNEANQTVVVTAPLGAKGDYKITVTATDGAGASKADTFAVTFANSDTVKAIDGYLKGALVFRDVDGDGLWDHSPINSVAVTQTNGNYAVVINNGGAFTAEPWGITNERGESPIIGGAGTDGDKPLRVVAWTHGGAVNGNQDVVLETIDISTNRPWDGGYSAPANSSIVNPLSTLAAAVGGDVTKVRTALGLAASIDPFNTDPLALAADATTIEGARDALRAQAISIQVANILRVAQEAADSVGLTNSAKVAETVGLKLVGSGNAAVDLTSAAGLKSVIEQLATLATGNASVALKAAAESVAKGLATINSAISQAVESAVTKAGANFENLDVGAALSAAVQYQIVAQEVLAQAAAKAVAGVAVTGDTSLLANALASLADLISGDAAKITSFLDSAIIQTRASVGTVFVSSAKTVAATAIDDNAFALYRSAADKGGVSGNLLNNDLVPIGFSKSVFSARAGDELAATPTYSALTGTSFSSFTGAHGTLKLWADGRYEYTVTTTLSQPDTVVEDAFSYRLSADGTATIAPAARYDFGSLVIAVSNRNDPPVVQLLQDEVFEQGIGVDPLARGVAAFNLLRAGADPEGATLQLGTVSFKPQVGLVRTLGTGAGAEILGEFGTFKRVALTGEFVYTLDQEKADFLTASDTRTEVFTFSLSDGVKSTESSVVVTIRGADDAAPTENRAPVGFDKTIIIQEDTAYTFKPADDFLFRDPNPQDTLSKVKIVQLPSSTAGALTLDARAVQANELIDAAVLNKLVFTPAANVNGSEVAKFTFRVVDAGGLESAQAKTIAFDIKAVNDAPVGTADALAATEDTAVTFTAAQLLGNDTDVDGDTLSIKSVTAVTGGAVVRNQDGTVLFTPTANFNGAASFTYVATDGKLDSAAATATVTVAAVNDAPVGVADALAATEDTAVTYTAAQLLGNDTDVDGDTLSIKSVTAVTGGTVVRNQDGTVRFTPTANFNGTASFSYVATDGKLDTAAVTATVTVAAVNDAPVGTADTLAATEDTAVTYTAAQLLGNDTDVDGDTLSIKSVTAITGGSVVLNTDGTVRFTPTANFSSAASFSYVVTDGKLDAAATTVTVNVAAVNDRPVFASTTLSKFSLKEFSASSAPPPGQPSPHDVLFTAAASDPDSSGPGALTYSIVLSPPANASAELSSPSLYEDGALFRINPSTGEITFIRDPITQGVFDREFSFELDLDANKDGIFRFVVEVSDGTLRDYLPIEITLGNVDEAGTLEIFRVNQNSVEAKLSANAAVRQGDVLQARLVEPDEFSLTGPGPIDYGEIYEWFADGVKILRPTSDVGKSTLTLTDSLIGRKISVRAAYSEESIFGTGTDLVNEVTSVTLGAVERANAAPTLVPSSGSLGSITVTVGSAITPFDLKQFFADDGGVNQLTFTMRDSTGAALPDGLTIGSDGTLSGTPQAGWITTQPRTLHVTATDQGGASVTGTLTVQGQAASGKPGIYLTSSQVGMVDFSGSALTESRSSTIGQFVADAASQGKARLTALISGTSDGAPVGADLDRGNLLNLLDANPATGGVPYITMPVVSTLGPSSEYAGKLALKLALQGVFDVSAEVNVKLVTSSAGVTRIVVVGDQTALAGLVSFKNGDELGQTISSDGRTLMRIDLLALLDKGITASGKSILAGVVTDDLEASFSVGFVDLPIYTPAGVSLSGVDASVVIDDTPNRAPSIVMPHGPDNGTKKLAVALPAGTAVGVGALLADLNADGGLFPDRINDVNGDPLHVLLAQPTSGQLIYRGDVVIFPSAVGVGQSDFVWGGGRPWLRVPIADIGLLEYRSGPSANVPAGQSAELASMQVVIADSFRAMSVPATVDIAISAKPVDTVLAAANDSLSLVSVPGVSTMGSLGISGEATVMAVPNVSVGKLFKGTVSGTTLVNTVEVKVGDIISASDRFGFTPATSASGAFRDDLLLQQVGTGGVSYLRIDFGLAAVGADALGAVTVTSAANVANVLDAGQIVENAQIPSGGVKVASITSPGTYNYSLSGPDAAFFERVSDQQGTFIVFKGPSPNYESKGSYVVRVNADNPSVGPQGSVETFVDYTVGVKNVADTLELAANSLRLTDYGANGVARPMALISGEFSSVDGRNVLNFSTGSSGAGLSRINLQRLFDGNPATGKAPVIGFDLGDLSQVAVGTHRLQVTAEMQAAGLGDALPLRMSFPVDVAISRSGSILSLSLPAQQGSMQLSAGEMALGSLSFSNLDSDLFSLSQSNSSPAQLAMKLDSLLDKSESDKVSLASLGQGGTLAFAGAIAVSALADKSLGELVTLVRDTAAVPSEMRNTTLGRMIDLLQNTVTVPTSLSTMKFDQALSLGAKLVLPEAMGSATLSSVLGLGVKVLGLPAEIDSVGEVLKVLRDAVELPPSLRGTLGSLKDDLADTQREYQLLEHMESLVRGLLSTNGVRYEGSLSNKTIPQLLDMMASSQMGSMSLSSLGTMANQSFGGYTVPEVLRLASDIVGNFYGDLTMNQILSKSSTAITLPSGSSSLGNLSVGELLDVAQAVVVLGGVLQGNDSLVNLLGTTLSAASLANLIQDSVTVDGKISGRSLANVLQLADSAFNIGQYLGAGDDLSDLINDLRNDQVDVGMMTSLASRALFSDQGLLKVRVDLPPALGLLDEFDRPLQSIQLSAAVSPPVTLAAPTSKQGFMEGGTFNFGKFLRAGTVSDADGDLVKGVWVTDPSTGGDLKLGNTLFANGERKFVPFGGQSTTALDLEDLQFVPSAAANTSVALQYVVEDTRGALSLPVTYQYVI